MTTRPRGRAIAQPLLRSLTAPLTCILLLAYPFPAAALDTGDTPAPVTGNATWFDALGSPYGGCGLPQDELDSPHFVALNVYNTPGDYNFYPRPLTGDNLSKMGMWNNGHNCGRWIRVKVGDYCTGVNDGAPNQPFCRNGSWVADEYNGATLDMIIADSCGDSNAWCRDDPYHIDLAHASLNQFARDGVLVRDMDPDHWNNRQLEWEFIEAPNYSGDIKIGFLAGSSPWWTAVAVSHLANGIHGVEYYSEGRWTDAELDGDMGQAFLVEPLVEGETDYEIRVRDVDDELIHDGRVYKFSLPSSCSPQCGPAYLQVPYSTAKEPTSIEAGTCTATYETAKSWPGGFVGTVTVTATGTTVKGWTVNWTLADGQSINSSWNGTLSTSGSTVTVRNATWNGTLKAGATAEFGFVGNGEPSAPELTCAPG